VPEISDRIRIEGEFDPEGRIAALYRDMQPRPRNQEVIAEVRRLQTPKTGGGRIENLWLSPVVY
jgi:hypothetical protein